MQAMCVKHLSKNPFYMCWANQHILYNTKALQQIPAGGNHNLMILFVVRGVDSIQSSFLRLQFVMPSSRYTIICLSVSVVEGLPVATDIITDVVFLNLEYVVIIFETFALQEWCRPCEPL